jgi:hypothetical protein
MMYLKQSTAVTVQFGPFVDKTDGVSLETGLATAMDNATTGIRVSKNGAVFVDRNSATAPAYDAMGCYRVELDATDTSAVGTLKIIFEEAATTLPVWMDFMVLPANAYDSLVGGTDTLQADLTQIGGVAQSATDLKDFADDGYDPATNKVQGVVLVDTTTTNTDMRGTDSALLASSAPTNFGDLAITVTTGEVTVGTNNDKTGYTASTVSDKTGYSLSAAGVDAIWDETTSGHTTVGTFGRAATISGEIIQDTTITGTPTSTTFELTAGSTIDDFYNDQQVYIISGTGAGQSRIIADYTGSTKQILVDEPWVTTPAASDQVIIRAAHVHTKSQVAGAVWDETMAGHVTADTAGLVMNDLQDGGRLDLIIDELTTNIDAIETDTQDIQTQVGTAGAGLTGIPWNAAWDAEVESEVNDALDTAISELTQTAPTATPTIRTGLMLLYMMARNKLVTQTSGTDALEVYNDAGTLICKKLLTDDGSDYTEAEMTSGP